MQFEVVSGDIIVGVERVCTALGKWCVQTTELDDQITQLFVFHHLYNGANHSEYQTQHPIVVEDEVLLLIDHSSYVDFEETFADNLMIFSSGVACRVPNGEYPIYFTLDELGRVNSVRIEIKL